MNKNALDIYIDFYKKQIWNDNVLQLLLKQNVLTQNDVDTIKTHSISTYSEPANELYYEIWDKISPINGVEAEKYIESMGLQYADDIILFKIGNRVLYSIDAEIGKINNDIPISTPTDEVGKILVNKYNAERNTNIVGVEELKIGAKMYSDALKNEELSNIKLLLQHILQMLQGGN